MTAPLSIAEAAIRLGVDRKKVTAWIASGELRAFNTTLNPRATKPRWKIPVQSIEQFQLARQSQPAVQPRQRRRAVTKKKKYW